MWFRIGAINGFLAVAAGAFGAHALEGRLSLEQLQTYHTAAQYHMYHALALLVAALAIRHSRSAGTVWAAWSFLIGIVLFSGSLYAYAMIGTRWLAMITPIGGVAFLVGWVALASAYLKPRRAY